MTKVLVIDDNMLVGAMVSHYLETHDCTVEFANSPFGVLNTVRSFTPDVILLDINMPGLGGRGLARLLKDNRDRLNGFKVVLFSSEEEEMQRDMVEQALADGYFVKSGSVMGLEKVVMQHAYAADIAYA